MRLLITLLFTLCTSVAAYAEADAIPFRFCWTEKVQAFNGELRLFPTLDRPGHAYIKRPEKVKGEMMMLVEGEKYYVLRLGDSIHQFRHHDSCTLTFLHKSEGTGIEVESHLSLPGLPPGSMNKFILLPPIATEK